MYETHFGLRQRPFRTTPDSACYYPATTHEQALARLLRALADDEGFALLTGEPGSGKTLLCQCLLERVSSDTNSILLTNSHFNGRTGLLQAILFDLALPYENRSEQELRLALTDFLLKNYSAGRRTLVVVDEAHHLSPDLLEELRLLGNVEAPQGRALQILLVGQPRLLETLRRPLLAVLNQRLAVRVQVEPLALQEAADYLFNQIRHAGGRPEEMLTEEALELLAGRTHGVPRLLNQTMHQSLLFAQSMGTRQIDAEIVLEALATLGLDAETEATGTDRFAARPHDASPGDDKDSESVGKSDVRLDIAESNVAAGHLEMQRVDKMGRPCRLFATPRRPA